MRMQHGPFKARRLVVEVDGDNCPLAEAQVLVLEGGADPSNGVHYYTKKANGAVHRVYC